MKTEQAVQIKKLFQNSKEVVILMHTDPDGDAMGSSLGLFHFLKKKGSNVHLIAPTQYPDFLAWMPGIEEITVFNLDPSVCYNYLNNADLLICADFNTPDRLDDLQNEFNRCKAVKILIDHHINKGKFCDLEYTDIAVSSTSELVFRLIEQMHEQESIDSEIAECLYVGIMTDTGSFSYACNYDSTFRIAAELVKHGIDTESIHRKVYDTYSEKRLRLLGFCLSEKLIVQEEFGTAYIALSQKELEQFDYKNGDTEGVVNFTLGIKGIVFGALITERKDKVKVSLRSKGSFNVNEIARKHFNGGGHKNAAGGDLHCSFEEAVNLFRSLIPGYLPELNKAIYPDR